MVLTAERLPNNLEVEIPASESNENISLCKELTKESVGSKANNKDYISNSEFFCYLI